MFYKIIDKIMKVSESFISNFLAFKMKIIIVMCVVITLIIGTILMSKSSQEASHVNEKNHTYGEELKNDNSKDEHETKKEKRIIKLTNEQIKRLDIKTIKLTKSNFQQRMTLPGQITLNDNKITHIVAPVPGVVKEILKGLGEAVKPGESLATLQSRDMADAKSAHVSAYKNLSLIKEIYERDEKLWKQRVKAEIQFIQTRNSYENAKITLEETRQKLLALGMTEEQVQKLPEQQTPYNIYTIESPIDGKVMERHITLGEVISSDKQVFVIANLDTVWVSLAIPDEDLTKIKAGQQAFIYGHQGEAVQAGIIMYSSPAIDEKSRTGRAIIQLDNKEYIWHPGDFIKAQVVISEQSSYLNVPTSAIQNINGVPFMFIKIKNNSFEARAVQIKGSDKGEFIEILEGISEGEEIIIKNTFLLKAELAKSETSEPE